MSESPYKAGTTHFGFRDVAAKDKQKLVGQVFTSVARNYDLMNDLMSLGVHRAWKRYYVATAQVKPGDRVLDLAGGTGDIAALLKERVGAEGSVVLGDINAGMLSVGRDRLTNRGLVLGLDYVQCNAEALPFPDNSFDLVTIAFGLRNVTDKDAGLREMYRVLKVGGQARVLEFSEVSADWFKPIDLRKYHKLIIGRIVQATLSQIRKIRNKYRTEHTMGIQYGILTIMFIYVHILSSLLSPLFSEIKFLLMYYNKILIPSAWS